jgi:hypothetical protein
MPLADLYGLRLRSALPLPRTRGGTKTWCRGARRSADVAIVRGSVAQFAATRRVLDPPLDPTRWFEDRVLAGGSRYLRWSGLFEFVVAADGRRIAARRLARAAAMPRAFETYLLGQVLSFALIAHGLEPLHATAVVVGNGAVGFLGDCGQGKSTLGAAFVRAGHALLTDDLLVLRSNAGGFRAAAGPPRLKLFSEPARRVLGPRAQGTPMNGRGSKLVFPLSAGGARGAAPLRALYVLQPGRARRGVVIRALSPRRAFVALTRNTFNACVLDAARLARQFDLAARVAAAVPVKTLAYPRGLHRLAAVRAAVEADLSA